jgi:hypothetical protein
MSATLEKSINVSIECHHEIDRALEYFVPACRKKAISISETISQRQRAKNPKKLIR